MGENNKVRKERVKKTLWIEKYHDDFMKQNMELANARSENDFIRIALDFYIGYLKTDRSETFLLNTISSVLQSSIEASEKRINRYLYKVAIEQAIMNRIIGLEEGVSEEEFDRLLEVAEGEVKKI